MNNFELEIGDIILVNSNKMGAKIVKFLMQSPTIWHQIFRYFRGTLEEVPYYHVQMGLGNLFIAEQQRKVRLKGWNPDSVQIIFRRKDLNYSSKIYIQERIQKDLGKGYDVLNILGKILTWFTGIKFFGRYIQWPKREICVNRVAYWAKKEWGETFGVKTHSEVTTQSMYKYLLNNPNYEIVYKNDI